MKKRLQNLCIILLVLLTYSLRAQTQNGLWTGHQAYNWYFYDEAGLNFDTSSPTALTDGQILGTLNAEEGSGVISDEDGNLLFYTNGVTVWNNNNEVMQNGEGLLGAESTSQSGLAVPDPGSPDQYYIFYMDEEAYFSPLYYSKVNMALDGGLGAVIDKNTQLTSFGIGEKLTATYHADGHKIWIMGHKGNRTEGLDSEPSNEFLAFLISDTGIDDPVMSDVGEILIYSWGQMKFSPDGAKVALINNFIGSPQTLQVADFNNETGEVSNAKNLTPALSNPFSFFSYGLEFSPNSQFLYTTDTGLGGQARLRQFDLEAGSAEAIINSDVAIYTSELTDFENQFSALQLAPNGKIYMINHLSDHISVINYPNNQGTSAGFQLKSVDLVGKTAGFGLPGFIQTYFESGILHEGDGDCPGFEVTFSTIRIPGIDAINWDFGDGETGNGLTPVHSYNQSGIYTVTATITSNGAEQTAITEVEISEGAVANTPQNLTACDDGTGNALFDLTDQEGIILGNQDPTTHAIIYYNTEINAENEMDAITNPESYTSLGETIYIRVTNDLGCYAVTSLELIISPTPEVSDTLQQIGCSPFNLTAILEDIGSGLTVSYYETEADAQTGSTPIANPQNYVFNDSERTIYLRVANEEGCTSTVPLNLKQGECEIPQGISPNGDGINDSFDLTFLTAEAGGASLVIYNRYGTKVYKNQNYSKEWYGQDENGGQLPTGTYYYVLNLKNENPEFGKTIKRWVYLQNNK